MKKSLALSSVAVAFFFFASALYAQGTYYVQSARAKVMSAKSFKSRVLGKVERGFRFAASMREGSWVKVRFNGRDGYVPALILATHPPFQRTRVIRAGEGRIKQGVRRRASSYTSAAAARGLAQDDRRRLSRNEKSDYDAVDAIESYRVSPDEVARFMEGGRP